MFLTRYKIITTRPKGYSTDETIWHGIPKLLYDTLYRSFTARQSTHNR